MYGYKPILISTIVDFLPLSCCVYGYKPILISTIVDSTALAMLSSTATSLF